MDSPLFLSLAFVSSIHGFAMFAPYAILFLMSVYFLRAFRKARQPKPIPIPVERRAYHRPCDTDSRS